jgi:hypothetical protein
MSTNEREGWRNAQARQTYFLKNAVGDDFERQSAAVELRRQITPRSPRRRNPSKTVGNCRDNFLDRGQVSLAPGALRLGY